MVYYTRKGEKKRVKADGVGSELAVKTVPENRLLFDTDERYSEKLPETRTLGKSENG